jgi:DNA gyrase/topoisomerase IV subunit B
MKNSEIIKNEEVVQIIAALGLKLGEAPSNIRYGKIIIFSDADFDGNHISSLLINFFNRFWPELFEQGRMYKALTPIVVAKNSKTSICFYSNSEYNEWMEKNDVKKWNIEYKKGLAALEDDEYKDSLEAWFGKDSTPRKERILHNEN